MSDGVKTEALADLKRPTPPTEIKQRKAMGRNGPVIVNGQALMLDYVDARYVQDTLDEVVGSENWQSAFQDTPGGIRCGIGIKIDGEWVWKWDAGAPSMIEPVKGSHSDAFKRAAVQWGIARDLYEDRENAEPDAAVAQQNVAQQVGASRSERYTAYPEAEQYDQQQEQAQNGGESPPECPYHGLMVRRSGVKNNKPWAGFFCTDRQCQTQPVWIGRR